MFWPGLWCLESHCTGSVHSARKEGELGPCANKRPFPQPLEPCHAVRSRAQTRHCGFRLWGLSPSAAMTCAQSKDSLKSVATISRRRCLLLIYFLRYVLEPDFPSLRGKGRVFFFSPLLNLNCLISSIFFISLPTEALSLPEATAPEVRCASLLEAMWYRENQRGFCKQMGSVSCLPLTPSSCDGR